MGGLGAASVIVVGAGVFGLATGLALAEAGMKVRLMAATPPDLTASGVAAGMLAPAFEMALDPPAPDALDLLLASRDLWPDLAGRLGVSLDRTGAAAIGPEAWLDGLEARLAALGLKGRPAGRAEMEAMSSGLGSRIPRAFVTPQDWRIEPQAALQAMERGLGMADQPIRYRSLRSLLHKPEDADRASWTEALTQMDRVNPEDWK